MRVFPKAVDSEPELLQGGGDWSGVGLEIDGSFMRVQCKTGRLRDGCVIFRAQSVRSNSRKAVIRDYKDDVELFVVHCPDTGGLYVIPIDDATRTQGTLRIDPTANGQDRRVRWARDYELPA